MERPWRSKPLASQKGLLNSVRLLNQKYSLQKKQWLFKLLTAQKKAVKLKDRRHECVSLSFARYKLLHVLEFDANRRRMSVILQTPSGNIINHTVFLASVTRF